MLVHATWLLRVFSLLAAAKASNVCICICFELPIHFKLVFDFDTLIERCGFLHFFYNLSLNIKIPLPSLAKICLCLEFVCSFCIFLLLIEPHFLDFMHHFPIPILQIGGSDVLKGYTFYVCFCPGLMLATG